MPYNHAGSAQSISFDQFDNVVYWTNFIDNTHKVMKTMLTGSTVDLNITYSGEIEVTSDMFNFYVLDKDNDRIDKYSKTSLEKLGNITHDVDIMQLINGYGEYQRIIAKVLLPVFAYPLFRCECFTLRVAQGL